MHQLLNKMGHKQPKTPIKTDNSTAFAVIDNNIQLQCKKGHGHAFPLATIGNPEPTTPTTGPSITAQLTTSKAQGNSPSKIHT
jgi:hypothetical protein